MQELLADYLHVVSGTEIEPKQDDVLAGWMQRFGREGRLLHHHAPGCAECENSGFRGRAAIHELMAGSRGLRQLIQTGARVHELQRLALAEGMRTLRQDGIEKVLAGVTTIAEVRAASNE